MGRASAVTGPVTALRDEHQENWHAWDSTHHEQALAAASERQDRYQSITGEHAYRDGLPWTEDELVEVVRDRPITEIALKLGRTYRACSQARLRRLKALGLRAVRTKTETDPYDGADNRMKLEER